MGSWEAPPSFQPTRPCCCCCCLRPDGHPVGAVIMARATAEALRAAAPGGSLFSSAGGSPASCAAALAVLRAIRAEGLQARAEAVGARLRRRLEALAAAHPGIIGAVHGDGLYMGVELVSGPPRSLEPAPAETRAICERLLELGVVCQP